MGFPGFFDGNGLITTFKTALLDAMTGVLNVMGYEHHEIHGGSHFYLCGFDDDVADEEQIMFGLITPAGKKELHMTFAIEGSTETQFFIREGVTINPASLGTAVVPFNNNRNSLNTSVASLYAQPSLSNSGTQIFAQSKGKDITNPSRADSLGAVKREREIILKSDTQYLFIIQSKGAVNNVNYCGEWYEHTDRS